MHTHAISQHRGWNSVLCLLRHWMYWKSSDRGYTFFLHLQQVKQTTFPYIIVPTPTFPVHCAQPTPTLPKKLALHTHTHTHAHFNGSHEHRVPQSPKWSRTFFLPEIHFSTWLQSPGTFSTLGFFPPKRQITYFTTCLKHTSSTSPSMVLTLQRLIVIFVYFQCTAKSDKKEVRLERIWTLDWKVLCAFVKTLPNKCYTNVYSLGNRVTATSKSTSNLIFEAEKPEQRSKKICYRGSSSFEALALAIWYTFVDTLNKGLYAQWPFRQRQNKHKD